MAITLKSCWPSVGLTHCLIKYGLHFFSIRMACWAMDVVSTSKQPLSIKRKADEQNNVGPTSFFNDIPPQCKRKPNE